MASGHTGAISEVLDRLEDTAHGDSIAVAEVIDGLGRTSFASLMLVFSLIAASPASGIPGLTALVGVIVFMLIVQMLAGRDSVWLPDILTRRRLATSTLRKGIAWLRGPVGFVERFLKRRLTFLFHRPWIYLPLLLILALTAVMPLLEVIPTSGSIAGAVIALFAAGLLTRDGGLVALSLILLLGVPLAVWQVGFGA